MHLLQNKHYIKADKNMLVKNIRQTQQEFFKLHVRTSIIIDFALGLGADKNLALLALK